MKPSDPSPLLRRCACGLRPAPTTERIPSMCSKCGMPVRVFLAERVA
jgi:hypothetical protein